MASRTNNNKIVRYRRPFNLNIGMVIFAVMAIYILICVVIYIRSNPIVGYEVKVGSLSVNNIYTGIALRSEEIVKTQEAGYVNYYARESEKVACGDLVYTVDGSGKLAELMQSDTMGENSLSDADLNEVKADVVSFVKDFSPERFSDVYSFKYDLQGTTLKLSNLNILNSLDELQSGANGYGVKLCNAHKSGYIVYSTDGYEELEPHEVTKDILEKEDYEKVQLVNNELVAPGDSVYKFVTSEKWSIVIGVTPERAKELEEAEYVQVKFLKTQNVSWASTEIYSMGEDYFCILGFNNSMVNHCTERFIDIEVITKEEIGLKIPNSAIAEQEFFLIPKDFMAEESANDGVYCFLRETYSEDGAITTQKIDLTIYSENEEYYYVSDDMLRIGDNLIDEDSGEKFEISKKATLVGVYNMNKGYADFRQITILYQNEEYAIVKSNTDYGLSAYDYIVLDAKSVEEDSLVYE
ncbi:MAG: hypothetical protein J6A73_08425 [Lachnospiraceae bacterium]|nr:hypothetical protein [Lachnospiraceae bacterium]